MTRLNEALRRGLAPLGPAVAAALVALALVAVGTAAARYARDSGARAETLLLAVWSAAVLAPLALAAAARAGRERWAVWTPAAATLGVGMIVALLPRDGATRPAAVAALLVLALAAVASALFRTPRAGAAALGALALATALLAWGPRLWTAPAEVSTWLLTIALPAFAAAIALFFSRRDARHEGVLAGALVLVAPLVIGERWWILVALATLYLVARSAHRLSGMARVALGLGAALALLAGSFPWLRPDPVSAIFSGLAGAPLEEVDLGRKTALLSSSAPLLDVATTGAPLSALAIDTYLTNSVALPCGAKLADVELVGAAGSFRGELLVGRDSAEWAAERPDVARALACQPPPPLARFIPSAGRFFGRTSRAWLRLPEPFAAERIRLVRDATLPAGLTLAVFQLAVER